MPSKQIGAKRRGTGKVERNLLTFTGRPGCQEVSQKRGAVGGWSVCIRCLLGPGRSLAIATTTSLHARSCSPVIRPFAKQVDVCRHSLHLLESLHMFSQCSRSEGVGWRWRGSGGGDGG